MGKYKITIVETYKHDVEIEADSYDEAFKKANENWNQGQYDEELKNHFVEAEFY